MPVLQVKDVDLATVFYRDRLGFNIAGTWKDDHGTTSFAIVDLDNVTLGLAQNDEAVGTGETWAAYIYLQDINAFSDHVQGSGQPLTRDLIEQPYGCRDLEITDVDDNLLCFGQDMHPTEAGPGL